MSQLYPLAKLRERYGIGKQADINRRKHLGIKPQKIEGHYYITQDELNQLDALDHWLKEGNKMKDFDERLPVDSTGRSTGLDPVDSRPIDYQEATIIESEEQEQQSEWGPLIQMLAEKLQPARSPIENWKELEEANMDGY